MARLAIIWRNPRFSQPRRMWIPAASDTQHRVYLVVESASAADNEWNGLPNLEVIPGKRTATAASAKCSVQTGA